MADVELGNQAIGEDGHNEENQVDLNAQIEAEVARRMAATENDRREEAKRIAAEVARQAAAAAVAGQDGGPAKTQPDVTADLLRNVCGILNKGFNSLGSDLKNLKGSMDEQFVSLADNIEYNFEEWYGDGECPEDFMNGLTDGDPEMVRRAGRQHHSISDEETESEPESRRLKGASNLEGSAVSENLSLFARIAKEIKVPNDVGRDLDGDLANLINVLFENPPPLEEFVKMKESVRRPGNCDQLQVAPVPEAIWRKVSAELKGKDKVWQRLHGDFLLFVIKMLNCLDDFHKLLPVCPDIRSTVE